MFPPNLYSPPRPLKEPPPPSTRPGSWCERKGKEKAGERGGWFITDLVGGTWDFTMGWNELGAMKNPFLEIALSGQTREELFRWRETLIPMASGMS